jgi:hypothetical protein
MPESHRLTPEQLERARKGGFSRNPERQARLDARRAAREEQSAEKKLERLERRIEALERRAK